MSATETSTVFLVLQTNEETRPVVEAIRIDNPGATVKQEPAMVRISAPETLAVNRETIEEQIGRDYDLQELHVNLVTLSGHVNEEEDALTLSWAR